MEWTRKEFLKNAAALGAVAAVGTALWAPAKAQGGPPLRPPGALPPDEFLSRCIRCARCIDACPNQCLTPFTKESGARFSMAPGAGEEGTPAMFPRQQACNLCQGSSGDALRCTAACPTGALVRVSKTPQDIREKVDIGTARVDTNLCYSYNNASCGVCVRACPFEGKALKAGLHETPIIDPEYCVGCGLCERACIRYPQAITVRAAV